jgi:UBX domain-containing protein 7
MADNNGRNDELISQFMAFTGSADPAKAASYLEMSGNNVETAVGLFMEHEQGGGDLGGGGVASAAAGLGDEVRAPDATRTMRLMDDENPMAMMGMPHDAAYHLMSSMMDMDEQIAHSAFASAAVLNPRAALDAAIAGQAQGATSQEGKEDDNENDDDDEDFEVVAQVHEPARLSDMFAAPNHLIHRAGGFQGARTMAKDTKRWLLVNIQRDSEFASHALNRDVWRDELVENLIREGFIFWQQVRVVGVG